ncbi:MAG: hypothetical protein L6R40_005845 [Gallowayella cf. fulva]|nr:MAG: hypothetical protein L6R40_005845 [Xanthomendoza cf. fulva]
MAEMSIQHSKKRIITSQLRIINLAASQASHKTSTMQLTTILISIALLTTTAISSAVPNTLGIPSHCPPRPANASGLTENTELDFTKRNPSHNNEIDFQKRDCVYGAKLMRE